MAFEKLSTLKYSWKFRHISSKKHLVYRFFYHRHQIAYWQAWSCSSRSISSWHYQVANLSKMYWPQVGLCESKSLHQESIHLVEPWKFEEHVIDYCAQKTLRYQLHWRLGSQMYVELLRSGQDIAINFREISRVSAILQCSCLLSFLLCLTAFSALSRICSS